MKSQFTLHHENEFDLEETELEYYEDGCEEDDDGESEEEYL